MQMYSDEALEGWGEIFVKHGLFEAGARFVDFMSQPDAEKRLWLRMALQNKPIRHRPASPAGGVAETITPAAGACLTLLSGQVTRRLNPGAEA